MGQYTPVFQQQAVLDFVAIAGEDPDRDRLTDELRRRHTQLDSLRGRSAEIRQRLAQLADELADADAKARAALVHERIQLVSELATVPDEAMVAAHRYGRALRDWTAVIGRQTLEASNRAADAINASEQERSTLHRRLTVWLESTFLTERNAEAIEATKERLGEIHAEHAPYEEQRRVANGARSAVMLVLQRTFNDNLRHLDKVTDADVDQFAARARRQAA